MQADILQSVAFTWVFKLYLTDHITPATGKTVAITLSKNTAGPAAFGNPSVGASNATEVGNGWYYFISSTTDTGTLGPLIWLGTCTGCDNADQAYNVVKATNGGFTGIPDAVAGANAGLPILSSSATTLAYTVSTVTTVTNQLTAAQIATGIWQDATANDFNVTSSIGKSLYTGGVVPGGTNGLFIAGTNAATVVTTSFTTTFTGNLTGNVGGNVTGSVGSVTGLTPATIATAVWTDTTAGDFTTLTSPGKIIFAQLGGAFTTTASSIFSTTALANAPATSVPTVGQIATAVWQDATAGDFTAASSIGKSLYTAGVVPGANGGLFIAGTNAATTVTTSFTTTFTGNLTGSVGSVVGDTPQTGDSFALIGATGSGLTSLAPSATALSTATWTAARAGYLDNLSAGAVALASGVSLTLTQTLGAARNVSAVADTSLTVNDALHCAIANAAGQETVVGTVFTVKTPATATTLRIFALDSGTAPTSRT